jgi:multiple sugar transport system permease protein
MFYLSLHKYNLARGTSKELIGFDNFIRLLTHPQFLSSLKVTFLYTTIGVIGSMLLGFTLAMLLNMEGPLIRVLRGVALMPTLICSVSLTITWSLMYNPNFGLFNMVLQSMNLPIQNWLGNRSIALWALALTDVWQYTPFVMILTLAGLQGINVEYYEAASVDGANCVQRLFLITLPLLKNVLITIMVMRIIDTFKTFEKPRILTDGGPLKSTEVINLFVYRMSFISWDFGYGAAGAVIMALFIALLTFAIVKITSINE